MSKRKNKDRAKALDAGHTQALSQPAPAAPSERTGPYITLAGGDDRWGDIEIEIANLFNAAKAVHCIGEADDHDIITTNGVDVTAALRFLSVGIEARIDRLKGLLGLGEERP